MAQTHGAHQALNMKNLKQKVQTLQHELDSQCFIGDRIEVQLSHKHCEWGVIQYIGTLQHLLAAGDNRVYFGVELDAQRGENNGCIGQQEYFQCADNYGVFVTQHDILCIDRQKLRAYVGDSVEINEYGNGYIRWIGRLPNSQLGVLHFGVELSKSSGGHNGVHKGVRYFKCDSNCGVFCTSIDILSTKARKFVGKVGDHVQLKQDLGKGKIKFIGELVDFRGYIKYGIELLKKRGKNSGSYNGAEYFTCRAKHGVFVDEELISKVIKVQKLRYEVGDYVLLKDYGAGDIMFIGTVPQVPSHVVYGVDLKHPRGKNDGRAGQYRYFSTDANHGIYVTVKQIAEIIEPNKSNATSDPQENEEVESARESNDDESESTEEESDDDESDEDDDETDEESESTEDETSEDSEDEESDESESESESESEEKQRNPKLKGQKRPRHQKRPKQRNPKLGPKKRKHQKRPKDRSDKKVHYSRRKVKKPGQWSRYVVGLKQVEEI